MFKCLKCNKQFKYESKLNEHNKKKYLAIKKKMNYNVKYAILNLNVMLKK